MFLLYRLLLTFCTNASVSREEANIQAFDEDDEEEKIIGAI